MRIISCWGYKWMVNSWYNRRGWRASLAEVPPAAWPALPFCCRCQSQLGPAGMATLSPVLGKRSEILPRKFFILLPLCADMNKITTIFPRKEWNLKDLPSKRQLIYMESKGWGFWMEEKQRVTLHPRKSTSLPTWIHTPLEMTRGWIPQILHLTLAQPPPPQLLYFISKLIMNPDHSPNFLSVQ